MRMKVAMSLAATTLAFAGLAAAHEVVYTASLDGPSESPPNASPGTGFSTLTIDLDLLTMRVQADFSGLLGTTSACHIHGPTTDPFTGVASVMTPVPSFPGFPAGVTSGTYDMTFDLTDATSYNPAFVTSSGGTISDAMNRMLLAFEDGKAYLNIHTSMFPGGEIRGFYRLVPAPGALAMLGMGGLMAARRRR